MSRKRRRRRVAAAITVCAVLAVAIGIGLASLLDGASRLPVRNPGSHATYAANTHPAGASAVKTLVASTPAVTKAPTAVSTQTPESIAANARYTGSMEALSAILVDGDGVVLYEKQAGEKRYPASTTKILTALLVLENGKLEDVVRVGGEADMPPPDSSSARLIYGEKLTVLQLLNALLIPSGNDAAYVLAAYAGRKAAGDPDMKSAAAVEKFVRMMNARAQELGAVSSRFANPDGYHDSRHYTTARDIALIAAKAMEYSEFRKIVTTREYRLPVMGKDKDGKPQKNVRRFVNTNKLLREGNAWDIDCCTGIKTGHTSDAGSCLVSSAERGGIQVIAVVMGSTEEAVFRDSAALLQWGVTLG